MNREVHVRIWESPEVKFLRATRPTATSAPEKCCDAQRTVTLQFGAANSG